MEERKQRKCGLNKQILIVFQLQAFQALKSAFPLNLSQEQIDIQLGSG
jgi:hypothetical protein